MMRPGANLRDYHPPDVAMVINGSNSGSWPSLALRSA